MSIMGESECKHFTLTHAFSKFCQPQLSSCVPALETHLMLLSNGSHITPHMILRFASGEQLQHWLWQLRPSFWGESRELRLLPAVRAQKVTAKNVFAMGCAMGGIWTQTLTPTPPQTHPHPLRVAKILRRSGPYLAPTWCCKIFSHTAGGKTSFSPHVCIPKMFRNLGGLQICIKT